MQHSFDIEIAEKYGVSEAILLQHLWFWIEKNKANEVNFYDGTYWTYNSAKAFVKLFPYMTQRQIQNALKRLKEKGIIKTGNYNKSSYDRTLWYAFTELGKSIMQKCKMENTNLSNGLHKNVTPIPDINTNINTFIKTDINSIEDKDTINSISSTEVQQIINTWNSLGLQNIKFIKNNTNRYKMLNARIKEYGIDTFLQAISNIRNSSFLKGQNNRNWTITFDWLIKPNNFIKVLEGNYDDKENKGGFNNEPRSNTSKDNEPSKGKSKDEHDAEYWKEQNRILDEMLDSYLQM